MRTSQKQIPQISRERGEWAIVNNELGWERLFSCWDTAHSDGAAHFHLAAEPDADSRARSFAAMSRKLATCAYARSYGREVYTA